MKCNLSKLQKEKCKCVIFVLGKLRGVMLRHSKHAGKGLYAHASSAST